MITVYYGKFEIEVKLHAFLKKKRVLTRFVKNAKRQRSKNDKREVIEKPNQAFIWMDSPEKHDFWSLLHEEFENQLTKE